MKNDNYKSNENVEKIILTTKEILMKFVDVGVALYECGDKGRIYRHSIGEYYHQRQIDKLRLSQTLYELKKKKYIRIYFEDKEKVAELTDLGKDKLYKLIVEKLELSKNLPKEWDKKWRIVIFDIPDEKKSARDVLAGKLKYFGFIPIQESVFAYPYECFPEIDYIRKTYNISSYVQYIVADRIECEVNLIKHFFEIIN